MEREGKEKEGHRKEDFTTENMIALSIEAYAEILQVSRRFQSEGKKWTKM